MGSCCSGGTSSEHGPLLNSNTSIQGSPPSVNPNLHANNKNPQGVIFNEKGVYRGGFGAISAQVQGVQPTDLTLEKYPEEEVQKIETVHPNDSHLCIPPPFFPIFIPIPIYYRPPVAVGVSPLHVQGPIRTPAKGIPPGRLPPPGYKPPPISGGGGGGGLYNKPPPQRAPPARGHHFGGGIHSGGGRHFGVAG